MLEAKTTELGARGAYPLNELIEGLSFEDYCKADGINSHGLMDVLRSPAHFYERRFRKTPEKETEAKLFGTLVHKAVLEPEEFLRRHVVEPVFEGLTQNGEMSTRSKSALEKRAKWRKELAPGAIVLPDKHVDNLTSISERILAHPTLKNLLRDGVREITLFWIDPVTGLRCKARFDFISKLRHIVDLKTTVDARPRPFSRQIWNYNTHIQVAHYLQAAKVTGLCNPEIFVFVALEKEAPWEIGLYTAGASIREVGDGWWRRAMRTYAECVRTSLWTGYSPKAAALELPVYAEQVDPFEGQPEDASWLDNGGFKEPANG